MIEQLQHLQVDASLEAVTSVMATHHEAGLTMFLWLVGRHLPNGLNIDRDGDPRVD